MIQAIRKQLQDREWMVNAIYAERFDRIHERLLSLSPEQLIKESPARQVMSLQVDNQTYYGKYYKTPTVADKARFVVQRSKGRSEWENMMEASKRGVPIVEPVAYFENRVNGFLEQNCLITLGLEGSRQLLEFMEMNYDMFSGYGNLAVKRNFTRALARFVAFAMKAGLKHRDFHSANILFQGGVENPTFKLIDLADVEFTNGLSHEDFMSTLAGFSRYYHLCSSITDQAAFMAEFAKVMDWDAATRRNNCLELHNLCLNGNRKFWMKRRERAFENNRDFKIVDGETCQGSCNAGFAGNKEALFAKLEKKDFAPEGILKNGQTTLAAIDCLFAESKDKTYFFKIYKHKKTFGPIKDMFRGSRAARAWQAAYDLGLRHISTPKAWAYLNRKQGPVSTESMLVTEAFENPLRIYEEYRRLQQEGDHYQRTSYIAAFANRLRRMHDYCAYHGDLKGDNIMVRQRGRVWDFVFIDLDRFTVKIKASEGLALRDLAQVDREFLKWAGPRDRLRFLKYYLRGEGCNKATLKVWAKKILERRARMAK